MAQHVHDKSNSGDWAYSSTSTFGCTYRWRSTYDQSLRATRHFVLTLKKIKLQQIREWQAICSNTWEINRCSAWAPKLPAYDKALICANCVSSRPDGRMCIAAVYVMSSGGYISATSRRSNNISESNYDQPKQIEVESETSVDRRSISGDGSFH